MRKLQCLWTEVRSHNATRPAAKYLPHATQNGCTLIVYLRVVLPIYCVITAEKKSCSLGKTSLTSCQGAGDDDCCDSVLKTCVITIGWWEQVAIRKSERELSTLRQLFFFF